MELDTLFTAAMVSKDFRQKLLSNAALALADGYIDETFKLNPAERALVLSIRAKTIQDFAQQLHSRQDELLGAALPLVRADKHKDDALVRTRAISLLNSCRDLPFDVAA
jgi:hypothetical protein